MTFAIGLCISLPGKSPLTASGMRARAEVRAVISIGISLSADPFVTLSSTVFPEATRSLYLLTSSMPLRVAMPKSDMKPIMAGILTIHPVRLIATTPPIRASGRLSNTTVDCHRSRN